ncbi:MAG: hypothetical protein ABJL44_17485 [Algibacter sp.]
MKNYKLSFGEITILKENLAEVIVNEGEVINLVKVDEYHDFLLNNLVAPFSILINKKHQYCYDFDAQRVIGNIKGLEKFAVLITGAGGIMATETLIDVNRTDNWNIKLFREREDALGWLLRSKKEVS